MSYKIVSPNLYNVLSSYPKFYNRLFFMNLEKKGLQNIQLMDVSLRDGLQSFTPEIACKINLEHKKELYDEIISYHNPELIEVGSIVSPKVLPIMADSLEFLKYLNSCSYSYKNFLLVPGLKQLDKNLNNHCKYFSFIASISNSFQKENVRKTLNETKSELAEMMYKLEEMNNNKHDYFVKLYVSCINECPIEGVIDNKTVINELVNYYNSVKPDLLCISDTCGTLMASDFKIILDGCLERDIPIEKISLHLHVDKYKIYNTKHILYYSFEKKILNYDISYINAGGCSVTMNENKMNNNLTYNLFYKTLIDYLLTKTENTDQNNKDPYTINNFDNYDFK